MSKQIKVGDKIYVETHLHISRGSEDVEGGIATVTAIETDISGGKKCRFVSVKEHPGKGYNWDQHLLKIQAELKKEFGKRKAKVSPDIDRPWIEDGDMINGHVYHGDPIW